MRVIDITHKLDENVIIYEGDPRFSCETWRSVKDDGYMLSKMRMGTHTGTHVDAPCHFIDGGKTIAEVPLKRFVGKCIVTDDVDSIQPDCSRVIITAKSNGGKLTIQQAQKLLDSKVRLVGTGELSIGNDDVHKLLLANECVILEALNLQDAKVGSYILSAAPLKINADGSPIRACLIEPD